MSEIFVSYARSTSSQAHAVAAALREFGYGVWLDDELPAHRAYSEVIEERLRSAKVVIVLSSADAVKSQWVRSEANRGREDGKLVQLSLDDTPLPMPFDQVQCADLRQWTGDTSAPGWRKVVASVAELMSSQPSDHATPDAEPAHPGVSCSAGRAKAATIADRWRGVRNDCGPRDCVHLAAIGRASSRS